MVGPGLAFTLRFTDYLEPIYLVYKWLCCTYSMRMYVKFQTPEMGARELKPNNFTCYSIYIYIYIYIYIRNYVGL